jgi:hypothetical protein
MMKTRDERRAERDEALRRPRGKPTPTQEEADLRAMGVPHGEVGHADDGSGPDPHVERNKERTREMRPERKPGQGYETR